MKTFLTFTLILTTLVSATSQNISLQKDNRQRLIILADMGNEPDEQQQMMHMLMYSNEFDLEGLIAVTGKYLNPESTDPYKKILHPELFQQLIDGYSKVFENLKKHAEGYPDPDYLRKIVSTGQPGYGTNDVGEGKSSPGSGLIIKAVTKNDPRPVYIVVNAGSNTLAQALFDFNKGHSASELKVFVAKIRVFENGAQDNAGAWICSKYPEINWIRSNYQTYCYGGPGTDGGADNGGKKNNLGPYTWEPYKYSDNGQHQWALENIKGDHGPFGNYWPLRQFEDGRILNLEGGGTIPWLGLANKGLYDIDHPYWGGWSGRFSRVKHENYWSKHTSVNTDEKKVAPFSVYIEEPDKWINPENGDIYENIFAPVWRWRRAFYNDFACRMDWCIQPYEKANHNPVAAVDGDKTNNILFRTVKPGGKLTFDASASSDPDNDNLDYRWFNYQEAGTYNGEAKLVLVKPEQVNVTIPSDAAGKEIHIILEIKDRNIISSMFDYRRIVINVTEQ
jgi:hypothetical protein